MSTAARRKFWGWGLEGDGLAASELEQLGAVFTGRLGVDGVRAKEPPRVQELDLRAPRLVPRCRQGSMADFIVALGLVFVFEGLIFAIGPAAAKRAMMHVLDTPEQALRLVGVASALVGVVLVWLVRG